MNKPLYLHLGKQISYPTVQAYISITTKRIENGKKTHFIS